MLTFGAFDVFDEIGAYRFQYAYNPSSISDLSQIKINNLSDINKRWLNSIKEDGQYIRDLFLLEEYLIPCKNIWENDPDDIKIWNDCKKLKTKKAILNKYIDRIWEFVWEEYSYC